MEKMRTLAFQVPEDLFQKIKDYLHRNGISQKAFVIGLIEQEIERDLTEREAHSETQADDLEPGEEDTEQDETALVDDFEGVSDADEEIEEEDTESEDEEETEDEDMGPVMQM